MFNKSVVAKKIILSQEELLHERGEGTNGETEIGDNTQFDAFN